MKRSRLLVITAGAWALGLTALCAPAEAAPRCAVRGHVIPGVRHSRVTQTSASVVVYRTRSASVDTFWACRRGRNQRVLVGRDDSFQSGGGEYGPSTTLTKMQIAGDWLITVHETGVDQAAACSKYQPGSSCPAPVDTLVAVNVAIGRRGQLATVTTDHTDAAGNSTQATWKPTLLSSAGGVAWLQSSVTYAQGTSQPTTGPSSLYGCVAGASGSGGIGCSPRLVAQGTIDASSVQLIGTTLTWTADGQMQSTSL